MKRLPPLLVLGVLLGAFTLAPLAWLLVRAFSGHAWDVFAEEEMRLALRNTLFVSGGSALLALLLGTPLAFLLFRTELPLRRLFLTVFTLPSALPPFVLGMGWISLQRALPSALSVYSVPGMVLVLATAALPLVLLAGGSALTRVDPVLEEAARLSGAGPVRAWLSTTGALAAPSFFSGACLVFLFSASAFGVPYMLGVASSPPRLVLTTLIYGQLLQGGEEGLARAMMLSTSLLTLATGVLALNALLLRRARVRISSGKGIAARRSPLGKAAIPLAAMVALLAAALIVLPLVAVVLTSIQRVPGAALSLSDVSFTHWSGVLRSPRTWDAAWLSLRLALGAGVLVAGLGLWVALLRRSSPHSGRVMDVLATWPYAVPGTVLAMALLAAFARDWRVVWFERIALVLVLANTGWMLLVAYVGKYLALGVRGTAEAMAQLDASLEEAARLCGAGPLRTLRDVLLPLLRPALFSAFLLAFLACATELTLSVLLVPPGSQTLGTLLFELQSYADPASASVIACGFVLLVFLAAGAASRLSTTRTVSEHG